MIGKKTINRLSVSVLATLNPVVPMLSNFILAFLVIRFKGISQWGSVVEDMIVVSLVVHILSWGNRDFLIIRYAQQVNLVPKLWFSSFATRVLLILPVGAIFVLFYDPVKTIWIMLWVVGALLAQSLDSVITFSRNYIPSLVVEVLILATTAVIVGLSGELISYFLLVKVFALAAIVRGLALAFLYVRGSFGRSRVLTWDHFTLAAPFFVIGLSGFLQSKVDIYIVGSILSFGEVAVYQVVINLLLLAHMLFAMSISPFLGIMYRLNTEALARFVKTYYQIGFAVLIALVPLFYLVWEYVYHFELSWRVYLIAVLYLVPVIIYIPLIYDLYRKGFQRKVMYAGFIGAVVNICTTFTFVKLLGFEYALAGPMLTNWILLISYAKINRDDVQT